MLIAVVMVGSLSEYPFGFRFVIHYVIHCKRPHRRIKDNFGQFRWLFGGIGDRLAGQGLPGRIFGSFFSAAWGLWRRCGAIMARSKTAHRVSQSLTCRATANE